MRLRDDYEERRDIGGVHQEITDLWVPKSVEKRLIEAARLAERTGGPWKPKEFGSAWPIFQRELSDWFNVKFDEFGNAIGFEQIEKDERPRVNASSKQITRMEEALRWPIQYLQAQDGPRRVLAVYLRCRAYKKPFGRACKKLGWSRATAYRARDRALSIIAQGLNREGVPVDD